MQMFYTYEAHFVTPNPAAAAFPGQDCAYNRSTGPLSDSYRDYCAKKELY